MHQQQSQPTTLDLRQVPAVSAREAAALDTAGLRASFLGDGLQHPGRISLVYWETDRTIVGMAVPLASPLCLEAQQALKSSHFFERREAGVANVGGPGCARLDGRDHAMLPHDFLYIGAGTSEVVFSSDDPANPAQFYFVSYLAHRRCPSVHLPAAGRATTDLGSAAACNHRKLDRVIVPDRVETCQLVMGMTILCPGSVWNTMPPHTHERRSEVYFYFNLNADAAVIHMMGKPGETRHLVVRDREAVLSPSWSIHSGVGTAHYGFIWAMGGENKEFDDMDLVVARDLR